jgi:ribonuclease HI
MTSSGIWQIHIDGAARGNPGPAAFAFIIQKPGSPAIEEKGLLGVTTNNMAEYSALVRVLERAADLGVKRLLIHSDSELLVKQMNGEYRVKNADLREMYDRAKELICKFDSVQIRHIRREQNARADELCNQALDGGAENKKNEPLKDKKGEKRKLILEEIRKMAIEHLRSAAERWAEGYIQSPAPEEVWDQLWLMLHQNGVVCPEDAE